jgi:hypothetical protein
MSIDKSKHVWEGWTVGDFIEELEPQFDIAVSSNGWFGPQLKTREDIKAWCKDNQPYYKKHIPMVCDYFIKKANM